MKKNRIAILASGTGTNAGAIMEYFKGHHTIEVALVLTNNANAGVLHRAEKFGVSSKVFNREQFHSESGVVTWLKEAGISHVVLAGFLWLVPDALICAYPHHIVNIHPSLLPKFSGKGMYGSKVHEAVHAAAERETGITIHLVDARYDEGEILFQTSCPLTKDDSPLEIANRVHQLEHEHYPKVIEKWILD